MVFVLTAFMIVPISTRLLYDRPLKQAGYELEKARNRLPVFIYFSFLEYTLREVFLIVENEEFAHQLEI